MTERSNIDNIDTHMFADVDEILAERYGQRYRQYRLDYQKTLNSDATGFIPDYPLTVYVEVINRCNLTCRMCFTTNHRQPKSILDLATARRVIDECGANALPAINIGTGSEALLHKELRDIVAAARNAGIMDVFMNSNGILLREEISEFLIDTVTRIKISLDAATPETYAKVRGKDRLEDIERNILGLVSVKKRRNSLLPIIRLSFCVQDVNRHEREAFVNKWRSIADYVDFQQLFDFEPLIKLPHYDFLALPPGAETPSGGTEKLEHETGGDPFYCAYPFNSLTVWSNGNITPCCSFYGQPLVLGNVADMTLEQAWNGEKLRMIRDQILTGDLNPVCATCQGCRDTKPITADESAEAGTTTQSEKKAATVG